MGEVILTKRGHRVLLVVVAFVAAGAAAAVVAGASFVRSAMEDRTRALAVVLDAVRAECVIDAGDEAYWLRYQAVPDGFPRVAEVDVAGGRISFLAPARGGSGDLFVEGIAVGLVSWPPGAPGEAVGCEATLTRRVAHVRGVVTGSAPATFVEGCDGWTRPRGDGSFQLDVAAGTCALRAVTQLGDEELLGPSVTLSTSPGEGIDVGISTGDEERRPRSRAHDEESHQRFCEAWGAQIIMLQAGDAVDGYNSELADSRMARTLAGECGDDPPTTWEECFTAR